MEKVNRNSIARFFVGSCAALFAAAMSLPARAQVPAYAGDRDGRYVTDQDAQQGDDEYDDQAPDQDQYQDQHQGQDQGDYGDQGQYAQQAPYGDPAYDAQIADQDAYAYQDGGDGRYVVSDPCPGGCYEPYYSGGTTILFGAPGYRGRSYYSRSYARPGWHGRGGSGSLREARNMAWK